MEGDVLLLLLLSFGALLEPIRLVCFAFIFLFCVIGGVKRSCTLPPAGQEGVLQP